MDSKKTVTRLVAFSFGMKEEDLQKDDKHWLAE
jgi:hypothetical protein